MNASSNPVLISAETAAKAHDVMQRRRQLRQRYDPGTTAAMLLTEQGLLPDRWTCDGCGGTIECASDGRLEWLWSPATGRASKPILVHQRSAAQRRPRRVAQLSVVGASPAPLTTCGHVQSGGGLELLSIPIPHLTDADGLMQLLEMIASGRFDPLSLLLIIQRLHIPRYEAATPFIEECVRRGHVRPNLRSGFHWQGDLAEVLRRGPGTPAAIAGVQPSSAQAMMVSASSLLSEDQALGQVVDAMAKAACRVQDVLEAACFEEAGSIGEAGSISEVVATGFRDAIRDSEHVGGLLTDAADDLQRFPRKGGTLFVCSAVSMDGAERAAAGICLGSLFSLRRQSAATPQVTDFLSSARNQCLAGYFIYGYRLQLVLTDGTRIEWLARNPRTARFEPVRPVARQVASSPSGLDSLIWVIHHCLASTRLLEIPSQLHRPGVTVRLIHEAAPITLLLQAIGHAAMADESPAIDAVPKSLYQRCRFTVANALPPVGHDDTSGT